MKHLSPHLTYRSQKHLIAVQICEVLFSHRTAYRNSWKTICSATPAPSETHENDFSSVHCTRRDGGHTKYSTPFVQRSRLTDTRHANWILITARNEFQTHFHPLRTASFLQENQPVPWASPPRYALHTHKVWIWCAALGGISVCHLPLGENHEREYEPKKEKTKTKKQSRVACKCLSIGEGTSKREPTALNHRFGRLVCLCASRCGQPSSAVPRRYMIRRQPSSALSKKRAYLQQQPPCTGVLLLVLLMLLHCCR